jgi:hypothetical protein
MVRILRPHLADPEAEKISRAIWQAWWDYRDLVPSFDFQIGDDSTGDPAVWVWLVLDDGVNVEAAQTRARLDQLRGQIHESLRRAGITRWPYVRMQTRSDQKAALDGAAA